jgi:hypothetical protein
MNKILEAQLQPPTSFNRDQQIASGDWVDLTGAIMGVRDHGVVSILITKFLFDECVQSITNHAILNQIKSNLKHKKAFKIKRGKRDFRMYCLQTFEKIKDKQTLCYTLIGE